MSENPVAMSVASDSTTTSAASKNQGRTKALPSTVDKLPPGPAFDKIVRIKAGKDEKAEIFEVHQGLLKFYSGYFRVAIQNIEEGRFIEAEESMISLPEEKPDDLRAFVSWLYTRKLQMRDGEVMTDVESLFWLWCFADRREVPLLQNLVIDEMRFQMASKMRVDTFLLPFVYRETTSRSPLRRLFIKFVANSYKTASAAHLDDDSGGLWSEDSLRDLAIELMPRPAVWTGEQALKLDMCDFHIHEEGVRCTTGETKSA